MRKDHRPYFVKQLQLRYADWYTDKRLRPQFQYLGKSPAVIRPWNVNVFGYAVRVGDYAMIIAAPDARVNIISWAQADLADLSEIIQNAGKNNGKTAMDEAEKAEKWAGKGIVEIGDYALICPGVRIHAATRIKMGHGVMLAHGSYITDSDWHGIHDRCLPVGKTAPVEIGDNVWVGDHAIVCKGVSIGENSIIGAGSVVTRDIPANTIAAGNPAVAVRELDPNEPVKGRGAIFANYEETKWMLELADKDAHKNNSIKTWLRYILFPRSDD